ncbi:MAG: DUF2817 domain-containing protein [Sphingomonadales bacterium]|nr:DUF2817 domain-containing protein [Sphingomonadales bacterium]
MTPDIAHAAAHSFAASYQEARGRFLAATSGTSRAYALDAPGPDGEILHTDCCWIGPPDAERVIVILSATHGIEGYCGSGVQVDWLTSDARARLAEDQAVLLVHGLNAHGFAWDRRVTEEGCDLNRNCIDFARTVPANPAYEELAPFLVPPALDSATLAKAEHALGAYRDTHGQRAFDIAVKSGQYGDRFGMFFGGTGPSSARLLLEQIIGDYRLTERRFVTILDIHTGLGPFGYGEPQSEHDPASLSHRLAADLFGPSLTSPDLGSSFAVPVTGTLQMLWERFLGDGNHVYICLEYGVFEQAGNRAAYRLDHWHHRYGGGDPHSEQGQRVRKTMRDQFYSDRQDWREMIIFRARQIFGQALAAGA